MKIFFIGLGLYTVLITLLPFIKSDFWWIRVHDYPKFQIIAVALFCLTGFLFFFDSSEAGEIVFLVALVSCIIYQTLVIVPYLPFYKRQVKSSHSYTDDSVAGILVANVLMDNRNGEKLLQIITDCNPDIILAVETNEWWHDRLGVLQTKYPFSVVYPLDNTYGMLLYSRLELSDEKINFLVEEDIPSFFTKIKLKSGKDFDLYCVHPTPPVPGENDRSTERDAELLIIGKAAKKSGRPVVVAGDLNDVAWSFTTKLFQKTSGLLDPRIGRGFFNTFNAKYPFLRWPLDHVFHSNHFKLVELKRLSFFGSDHFPIYVKLHFEQNNEVEQEKPVGTQEDKLEAQEKIDKV